MVDTEIWGRFGAMTVTASAAFAMGQRAASALRAPDRRTSCMEPRALQTAPMEPMLIAIFRSAETATQHARLATGQGLAIV